MKLLKWSVLIVFLIYVRPSNEYNWNYIPIREVVVTDYFVEADCGEPCEDCPGINEVCKFCCKSTNGVNLICYQNKCQSCYDGSQWKCSSHIQNQNMLLTATQIAMSAALVLGVITIFVLFWKICTGTGQTQLSRRHNRHRERDSTRSGRSVDTLQQIISERLRDAPPPYTRAVLPPPGDTPPPYMQCSAGNVNLCFDADYNVAPPSYNTITQQTVQTTESETDKSNNPPNEDPTSERTIHI